MICDQSNYVIEFTNELIFHLIIWSTIHQWTYSWILCTDQAFFAFLLSSWYPVNVPVGLILNGQTHESKPLQNLRRRHNTQFLQALGWRGVGIRMPKANTFGGRVEGRYPVLGGKLWKPILVDVRNSIPCWFAGRLHFSSFVFLVVGVVRILICCICVTSQVV